MRKKRWISVGLALILAVLSPGLSGYRAAAETLGEAPSLPARELSLPLGGSFSISGRPELLGFSPLFNPGTGLALAFSLSVPQVGLAAALPAAVWMRRPPLPRSTVPLSREARQRAQAVAGGPLSTGPDLRDGTRTKALGDRRFDGRDLDEKGGSDLGRTGGAEEPQPSMGSADEAPAERSVLLAGTGDSGRLQGLRAAAAKHGVRLVVLSHPSEDSAVSLHRETPFHGVLASGGHEAISGEIVDRLNALGSAEKGLPKALVRGESASVVEDRGRGSRLRRFRTQPDFGNTYRGNLTDERSVRRAFSQMGGRVELWSEEAPDEKRIASSPADAVAAWGALAARHRRGIMMERVWEGPETRVEMIVQKDFAGRLEVVRYAVSDLTPEGAAFPTSVDPMLLMFPSAGSGTHVDMILKRDAAGVLQIARSRAAHLEGIPSSADPLLGRGEEGFVQLALRAARKRDISGAVRVTMSWSAAEGLVLSVSPSKITGFIAPALKAAEHLGIESGRVWANFTWTAEKGPRLTAIGKNPASSVLDLLDAPGAAEDELLSLFDEAKGLSSDRDDLLQRELLSPSGGNPSPAKESSAVPEDFGGRDANAAFRRIYDEAVQRRERIFSRAYLPQQVSRLTSMVFRSSFMVPFGWVSAGALGAFTGNFWYAVAIFLAAPITSAFAGRLLVRNALALTQAGRTLVYSALLTTGVFLFQGGPWFIPILAALNALDGVIVTVAGLFDTDEGGPDAIAEAYHVPLDGEARMHLNAVMSTWSAAIRLVGPPLVMWGAYELVKGGLLGASAAFTISLALGLSFLVPALIGIPLTLLFMSGNADAGNSVAIQWRRFIPQVLSEFKGALLLMRRERRVGGRAFFNASDRTVLETMPYILLTFFGLLVMAPTSVHYAPHHNETLHALGTLDGRVLIAAGCLGSLAVLSAFKGWREWGRWRPTSRVGRAARFLLTPFLWAQAISLRFGRWITPPSLRRWRSPKDDEAEYPRYRPFFSLSFWATTTTLLIPAATVLWPRHHVLAAALAAAGSFLFHAYFPIAKLGFGNMMQRAIKEHGHDEAGQQARERLFAAQSSLEMLASSVATAAMVWLFDLLPVASAMGVVCAYYLVIGLLNRFVAPRVLFTAEERQPH